MKKLWTKRLILAVIAASVFDVVSTYIGSPDLSHEANPILVAGGRTWGNLLALKFLISLVAIAIFPAGLGILQSRFYRLAGLSGFRSILSQLLFKREVSLWKLFLYERPKDWGAVSAMVCLTFATAIVAAGILAGVFNTLQAIRSDAALILLWCGSGVFSAGMAIWLTYRFCALAEKDDSQVFADSRRYQQNREMLNRY